MKTTAEKEHHQCHDRQTIRGKLFQFLKWWFAFTGLIASTSVCPFCGTPGCPVGIGAATTMGGAFSFIMQFCKAPFLWLRFRISERKNRVTHAAEK